MAARLDSGISLSEQDLVNIKQTVLTLERPEISRNVDPRRFFGHLRAKFVFDERDCDEICSCASRIASAELFVDILKRKGANGYDEFCIALMKDQTQTFLLQHMNKTLELLRSKVLERKALKKTYSTPMYDPMMPPNMVHQFNMPHQYPNGPMGLPPRRNTLPNSLATPPQQNSHRPLMKMHSRHSNEDVEQDNPDPLPNVIQEFHVNAQSHVVMHPYWSVPQSGSGPAPGHAYPTSGCGVTGFHPGYELESPPCGQPLAAAAMDQ